MFYFNILCRYYQLYSKHPSKLRPKYYDESVLSMDKSEFYWFDFENYHLVPVNNTIHTFKERPRCARVGNPIVNFYMFHEERTNKIKLVYYFYRYKHGIREVITYIEQYAGDTLIFKYIRFSKSSGKHLIREFYERINSKICILHRYPIKPDYELEYDHWDARSVFDKMVINITKGYNELCLFDESAVRLKKYYDMHDYEDEYGDECRRKYILDLENNPQKFPFAARYDMYEDGKYGCKKIKNIAELQKKLQLVPIKRIINTAKNGYKIDTMHVPYEMAPTLPNF